MKNFRYKVVIDIFAKLGKENLRIWFSGKEGEGEYKALYDNGKIYEHNFWNNGKRDGEARWWHYDGQIWEHSFWKNGKRDGEAKVWHDNGQISEHSFYRNGIKAKMSKNIKKGYIYADGKYWKD